MSELLGISDHVIVSLIRRHCDHVKTIFNYTLQVIIVFYFVLIRTTIAAAIHEVERTRAFVNRIPVHIIAREVRFNFILALESGSNQRESIFPCIQANNISL